MTRGRRLALKLAWMALLVFLLVVLSKSEFDFIYRGF